MRCRLIFLHGRYRTYRVASLRAGPVGRISYNLYFDCKHVRYVTCDLINKYTSFPCWRHPSFLASFLPSIIFRQLLLKLRGFIYDLFKTHIV